MSDPSPTPSDPGAAAPGVSPRPSTTSGRRRPPGRPLRRSGLERAVLTVGALATALSLAAAGTVYWFDGKFDKIETVEIDAIEEAEAGEPSNWLLVGSDSRAGIDSDDPNADIFLGDEVPAGKRTDTIMIARVDPENQVIDLLSVPRDLYVPIAGTGDSNRINTAFNGEDGERRLVETVENYFGFEINHYAEIDFVGFQEVVDALGGVPIWFDRPMRDFGSGLDVGSAGCHVLDGFQALAFARGRNLEFFSDGRWQIDGTGDLGRTTRQRYFIGRVAATATENLDFTSLGTINAVLDAGGENLVIDESVGQDDLLGLARTFASLGEDQIRGHSLPVYDFRSPTNAAVLGLQAEEAQPVLNIFRGIAPTEEADAASGAAATATYRVFNGSRVAGQASEVAALLGAAGFVVDDIDNEPGVTERTTIRYGTGLEGAAERLASHLVAEPVFELDESLDHVALVTGTDFDGLRDEPLPIGAVSPPAPATTTTVPAEAGPIEVVEEEAPGVVPGPSPAGTACG
ncbi:MAG: LCP family protein [Acidimicrobiales bacterium]